MQIDVRVMELLASKICHDLVSPVSAINNGVELVEDIGGSVADEAMKLIGDSAGHAARRLRLFRMAYGRAGNEESLGIKDVRQTAEQYIAAGKTTLNWPDDQPSPALASTRGCLKVILNTIIFAEEMLPYGGIVTLKGVTQGLDIGCRFEIVGRNASISPQIQTALDGTAPIDDLTPRTIQAYLIGRFAENYGLKLVTDLPVADRLDVTLFGGPAPTTV